MVTFLISLGLIILKLFAGYILLVLAKEVYTYIIYLVYYKPQGIKYHYEPFVGWMGLIFPREMNKKYVYNYFQHLVNTKFKGEKLIAFNQHNSLKVSLMPLDPATLGEFFAKEVKHTARKDAYSFPQDLGFFTQGGERAMNQRAVFNNFFQNENLKKTTPVIRKVVLQHFNKWKKEFWSESDKTEFKKIELIEMIPPMFIDLANTVLFGEVDFPVVEGLKMPQINKEMNGDVMKILMKPYNFLTYNVLHILQLLPMTRTMLRRVNKCNEEIIKTARRREKFPKEKRGTNVFDLMLSYNKECKDEKKKLTDEEICQNVSIFQIAGTDTSNSVTEISLRTFSLNEKFIKKMEEESKKIFSEKNDHDLYDTYEQSKFLDNFIKEIMRINPIVGISTPRIVAKNMKLDKYKLYKGSQIIIPFLALHMNEDNFENPFNFDPDRFNQKVKRNTYLGFSAGRRDCIGKNFGELMVKVILSNFFREFEVKAINDEELVTVNRLVVGVDSCKMMIRPRE